MIWNMEQKNRKGLTRTGFLPESVLGWLLK